MNDNSIFDEVLELLMKNKQFPYYAAERRLDIFINFFLEDILTAYYKNEEVEFVAPEFPFKHEKNNQADKLDYLCAFKVTKQPIFVELKTDARSFKKKQCDYYLEKADSWETCVDELLNIMRTPNMHSAYRVKYFRLLMRLYERGLITIPEGAMGIVKEIESIISCISQREKTKRSRLIIDLCAENISSGSLNRSRIIYLAPPLKYEDQEYLRKNKIDFVNLAQLSNFTDSVKPECRSEFDHLAKLLAEAF
jgi:hypothetical protein